MSNWCTGCTRSCRCRIPTCYRIVRHYELDPSKLAADFTAALDKLPRGATSISDLSPQIDEAVERGWVFGTLMFGESQVRTGHLMLGCLNTPTLRNALNAISRQFQVLKADALADDFAKILANSPEAALAAADGSSFGGAGAPGEASGAMAPAQMGKQEALQPVLGRSDRAGAQGRARSDRRARPGDPPGGRRADAPAAEQPDPDRRGRRRQDRGGRGLCAAHRRRRRAAGAARRQPAHAGCRPAAGRRLL